MVQRTVRAKTRICPVRAYVSFLRRRSLSLVRIENLMSIAARAILLLRSRETATMAARSAIGPQVRVCTEE